MKAKFLSNSLAAIVASVFAAGASAATFNFNQYSGFDPAFLASTDNQGADNSINWYDSPLGNASPTGTFDTVAWGLPSVNNGGAVGFDPFSININPDSDYSGLRVLGLSGQLTTGAGSSFGGWVPISTTYHRNQTISGAAFTLTNALIYSEFEIVEPAIINPNAIPFSFLETVNAALNDDAANCTNGAPQNTVCDDLFRFPNAGFAPLQFSYLGKLYEIQFAIDNFVNASTNFPGCNNSSECTVWTAEEQISSLDVVARIREVPEPSTIALLGAALLGLGFRRRKS